MLSKIRLLILLSIAVSQVSGSTLTWDRTEARIELEPNQEEARASFTVTNEGSETIRISRVKTTCGCTGSILRKKIIEPGESTEIVGTFNKGKRQGRNHNRLEVFIDNQAESVATLHMIVQVPQLIDLQPKIVYWNKNSAKTERTVRITFDERYIAEITEITYNQNKLTVTRESDPIDEDRESLRILPKSFESNLRETVVIKAKGSGGLTGEGRLHVFVQP